MVCLKNGFTGGRSRALPHRSDWRHGGWVSGATTRPGCCAGGGGTARPPCDSASRLSPAWSGPATAVLEGRALAADRSHPTQLGSGRSHAVD